MSAPIPADPTLAGATVYTQVLVADAHATGDVSHSGGLAITLCE